MQISTIVKPTALFAAIGAPFSAEAATVLDVDYQATSGGTQITIGNTATAQYRFDLSNEGKKATIFSNGESRIAEPGSNLFLPFAATYDVSGGSTRNGAFPGDYALTFKIGTDDYTGFATVDSTGRRITRISYDLAGAAAVPEPATWAMLMVGFGAAGVAMRRRRQSGARLAA